jgi:hypothetical protein
MRRIELPAVAPDDGALLSIEIEERDLQAVAATTARLTAMVVLPTPLFWAMMAVFFTAEILQVCTLDVVADCWSSAFMNHKSVMSSVKAGCALSSGSDCGWRVYHSAVRW